MKDRHPKSGSFGKRIIIVRALRDSLGLPFLILLASYIGFGSLATSSGFSIESAIISTLGIWGLPGQVAMAELYAAKAGLIAIGLAIAVANARFLLMGVSFIPLLRPGLKSRKSEYGLVALMSTFSWAACRKVFPQLPKELRTVYFTVYAGVCLFGAALGTVLGFQLTGTLPKSFSLGLLFLNPLFFALIFADVRERNIIASLVAGAVLGPLLHLVSTDWGVICAGLVAGTAAFLFVRQSAKDHSNNR